MGRSWLRWADSLTTHVRGHPANKAGGLEAKNGAALVPANAPLTITTPAWARAEDTRRWRGTTTGEPGRLTQWKGKQLGPS